MTRICVMGFGGKVENKEEVQVVIARYVFNFSHQFNTLSPRDSMGFNISRG